MMRLELLLSVLCMLNILQQNPQLSHTPSFGAHWFSSSNSSCNNNRHKQIPSCPLGNDYGIIATTPHKCRSPRKLFCLFSHFLLSSPFFHSPCFLSFITPNSTILLKITKDGKNNMLCLDCLTLVLEGKKVCNYNKTKK